MNARRYLLKNGVQVITTIICTSIISIGIYILESKGFFSVPFENKSAKELGLLLVQINSITVGLLTAFYFFRVQNIESQRITFFLEFKKTVENLINYKITLPNKLSDFDKPISNILNLVASTYDDDFPYDTDEWAILQTNTKEIIAKSKLLDPTQGNYLLSNLADIEFYAGKIGVLIISTWLSDFLKDSIKKQILFLVGLLFILIVFSIELIKSKFVIISISVFLVIMTINSLLELLFFILDYSKNLKNN